MKGWNKGQICQCLSVCQPNLYHGPAYLPLSAACCGGRITHSFITHIIDSAVTRPNKGEISPGLRLCGEKQAQGLLKWYESFMRWGTAVSSISVGRGRKVGISGEEKV